MIFLASFLATAAEPELRGVWVTRWSYGSAEDVDAILDDAASANLNAVYFQVRGRFDAFYASEHEPWAKELSGTLGKDPGWDPLAYAVEGAHERGLQLHAWMNAYTMWQGVVPPKSSGVKHAWNTHRDWLVVDASTNEKQPLHRGYVFADAANAEVRERLLTVAADVGTRYAVDGVHLDYIRYPGRQFGSDAGRKAIVSTLEELQGKVDIPVTAAVWGIYEDQWGWRSSQGNRDYYQDSRAFMATGGVDGIMPMIYWASNPGKRLDFGTLAADHLAHRAEASVYPGVAAHELGWDDVLKCITAARAADAQGVVLFEYKALRDKKMLAKLKAGPFAEKVVLPLRTQSKE